MSQSPVGQLYALVAQAIQENTDDEARQSLAELAARPDIPQPFKDLIERLQAILSGDRNPALVADPELDFWNAAELQLLLERVTAVLP